MFNDKREEALRGVNLLGEHRSRPRAAAVKGRNGIRQPVSAEPVSPSVVRTDGGLVRGGISRRG